VRTYVATCAQSESVQPAKANTIANARIVRIPPLNLSQNLSRNDRGNSEQKQELG